jgi:hypothetical protein
MLTHLRWVLAAATLILSPVLVAQTPQVFPRTCPNGSDLPFADIAKQRGIDTTCPDPAGDPGKDKTKTPSQVEASKTQNRVKNNFCAATPQPPETVTPDSLIGLPQDPFSTPSAKKPSPKKPSKKTPSARGKEPADRQLLQGLGEGKLVRMKGFLVEAHFADLSGGESVNCDIAKDEASNDIHIALSAKDGAKECASVSAEITPHFRPDSWAEIGNLQRFDGKKNVVDQQLAKRLKAQPYRITGQLFFDASHQPCSCKATCPKGNPIRSSLWEIHPVYVIEVCKAGSGCDVAKDEDWIAFDTWWKTPAAEKPASPPPPGSRGHGGM